eukprot:CAMPEP_0113468376 /NCGR_PEP_ID=MMETSP0014_2-20120614/15323_1 /TAXON_ID=2857 /ORGANISM="Nitzschia sp." /LENGTH=127 /DNA_ID=CAMNT_0000360763 /DNA_START=520 /DNA_END=903 /DNA_ORIENTATION=- /assembly_acc=CAM_ASM_000159
MTNSNHQSLREKKRMRIRRHLHDMSPDEFHRRCASHIRAIRYLRLRNQEVAMVNCISRLRRFLNDERQRRLRRDIILHRSSSTQSGSGGRRSNNDNDEEEGTAKDDVVVVIGGNKDVGKHQNKRPKE